MRKTDLFMVLMTAIIIAAIFALALVAIAFLWMLFHTENILAVGGVIILAFMLLAAWGASRI